mgnify:FL=1
MDADKNSVVLRLNEPFSTVDPSIRLRGLRIPGEYQFRLVVVDVAGNRSQPAQVSVTVEKPATLWWVVRSRLVAVMKRLSGFLRR